MSPSERETSSLGAAAQRAWAELRQRLRDAGAEGFARVEEPGVVEGLQQAWAAFVGAGGRLGTRPGEHDGFAQGLERLPGLGRHDRSVVIALGIRLCMAWEGQPRPPAARPKPGAPRHRAAGAAAAAS
ncbi:MAG: hypothetical protein KC501_11110, partial [Myxococcales bacterium]|nr:hypothetical protein [Myxococcales bacterium]